MIDSISPEDRFHNHVDEFVRVVNQHITDRMAIEMISETAKDLKNGATNYLQETADLDELVQKQISAGLYERDKHPDEQQIETEITRAENFLNGALEAIVEYIEDKDIDPDVYTAVAEALDAHLIQPLDAMNVAFSEDLLASNTVKLSIMDIDSLPKDQSWENRLESSAKERRFEI